MFFTLSYRFFLYILWPMLLYPLTNFILVKFIPFIKQRKSFENKNSFSLPSSLSSRSFKLDNKKAKVAFEISSEGELEQIRPLINKLLNDNQLLEIIFCSESVEKNVINLYEKYPDNLRILRLPLVTYFPYVNYVNCAGIDYHTTSVSKWISASTLILCRYDFFPELMLFGRRADIYFVLLSATLKDKLNKIKKNIINYYYYKFIYNSFDQIITPTPLDEERFKKHFKIDTSTMDIRILQVAERVKNRLTKLNSLSFFNQLQKFISSFPKDNTIILGSFWEIEAKIFDNKRLIEAIISKDIHVAIVPHLLDENSLQKIINTISYESQLPVYVINEINESKEEIFEKIAKTNGIIIFAIKGILCELYSLYAHAFVGGGHGRSIHSVIEPYLSNCLTYVGPKVFRSTEYELVKEISKNEIFIINELSTFYDVVSTNTNCDKSININTSTREKLIASMKIPFENFMQKI
ncbi:MAG: hypothetical protein HQK51_00225 [Oligoflexia bacterium]|nr:hypothetical protein [Oligoflexia bacterium]